MPLAACQHVSTVLGSSDMRVVVSLTFLLLWAAPLAHAEPKLLRTETLAGKGVWVDPRFEAVFQRAARVRATVWFEEQFLGGGDAYARRAKEFAKAKRTELRTAVVATLKATADRSWQAAERAIQVLLEDERVRAVERFWIVNGFSDCAATSRSSGIGNR